MNGTADGAEKKKKKKKKSLAAEEGADGMEAVAATAAAEEQPVKKKKKKAALESQANGIHAPETEKVGGLQQHLRTLPLMCHRYYQMCTCRMQVSTTCFCACRRKKRRRPSPWMGAEAMQFDSALTLGLLHASCCLCL